MKNLKNLTEGAIMVALSTVLSLFPIYTLPLGGEVTFAATLPLCIYAFRRGTKSGLLAAFLYSIIQLILGLSNLSYATDFVSAAAIVLFDYIVPYTAFGMIGMFGKLVLSKKERLSNSLSLSLGVISAVVFRFLCHLVSGAVVWYGLTKEWYADDPTHIVFKLSMWDYSFVYNITYILPELILTAIAAALVSVFINVKNDNLRYTRA
ncbi:MAG: energy-coupled thiamine transporter ThiT [Oscillospiraceae bacterium]|nr:energy-coupled thiamine transporter ThiT [Oscillospiraceae bacterium]